MSTRSRIGVIRGEKIESVYCHFDGYPTGVGATLAAHWMDPEKVDALIGLGDLSALGEEIGEAHDFDTHTGSYVDGEYVIGEHSGKWCLAYGRDRGEDRTEAGTHTIDAWPDSGQEWEYLYEPIGHTWQCRERAWNGPAQAFEGIQLWIAREQKRIDEYLASHPA